VSTEAEGETHGAAGAAASKGVLGRGSIYTIGTAAPILANVAVVPVVTRMLGKPGYGVVAIAIVVIQVAMMAGSFGMPSVITRQGILAQSGVAGARALLIRGSLMTVGLIAAIILTAPLWDRLVQVPLRNAVLLALAASAFFVVVENSQALLRVLDRPGAFVSLSLTATLGGPLLGLALLALHRSPERYLSGLTAGYAAAAAVGLILCLRGGRPAGDRGDTRAALRMGLPVIPHLVALFLANGALVFLAGQLYDVATAGRIQLALLVGSSPAVITSALNNSWAPIVYRAPEHERGAVLAHTARDVTTLAALVSGGVALLSPWLLRFVAGASFAPLELELRPYTADVLLQGDETLELARMSFQTLRVPGHSPAHLAYYADGALFSGDVVFAGSVGRTDLPGADWDTLVESIRTLVDRLPPETLVFPGHGPRTTLGAELARNPFLAELRA